MPRNQRLLSGFLTVTATVAMLLPSYFHYRIISSNRCARDPKCVSAIPRVLAVKPTPNTALCKIHSDSNYSVQIEPLPLQQTEKLFQDLLPGGVWQPTSCTPRGHTAIIIPYRDRENDLTVLLQNLHPFLQSQNIHYQVFVIEQHESSIFNLGFMRNVGFLEASATYNFTCYIFHDVDKIPMNNSLQYVCPPGKALHFSSAERKHSFRLPYSNYIGGVLGLRPDIFRKANGYSTGYLGWGGEDDDLFLRMRSRNIATTHANTKAGRYNVDRHPVVANPNYTAMLKFVNRLYKAYGPWDDGLNTMNYTILAKEARRAYTWIKVGYDQDAMMKKLWKGIMDSAYEEKYNRTWWNVNKGRAHKQFPKIFDKHP